MALAAHFEKESTDDERTTERDALEWLATLPPPDLVIPGHAARDVLSVYVPVNDLKGGDALLRRSRQPRTCPRVHVGDAPVRLIYRRDPSHFPQHLAALESLCRHVSRVGHSSSLVWMRLERNGIVGATHKPDDTGLGVKLRSPFGSMMKHLQDLFAEAARQQYTELKRDIKQLKSEIRALNGKSAKARKELLQARLDALEKSASREPRDPIRPTISHATSYVEVNDSTPNDAPSSIFDANFIVLREHDDNGRSVGLESTSQVVAALRKRIHDLFPDRKAPPVICGHDDNGNKLQDQPHIAIVPLAFVGRHWVRPEQFADGHLMGVGIFVPKSRRAECGKALSKLLFADDGYSPARIDLSLHGAGVWSLVRQTTIPNRLTLDPQTYTKASTSWASVTPLMLDRMPKSDRQKDLAAWREEVQGIVAQSCVNIGLPKPLSVRVEKTPFFVGSLRAMPGQGGFPQPRKDKLQVHAQIDFGEPVRGPIVLGAGRFQGYGLMRPWTPEGL